MYHFDLSISGELFIRFFGKFQTENIYRKNIFNDSVCMCVPDTYTY